MFSDKLGTFGTLESLGCIECVCEFDWLGPTPCVSIRLDINGSVPRASHCHHHKQICVNT